MEDYFPTVVQTIPGDGRTVYAYFSDGSIRLYDVAPYIRAGTVFEKLQNEDFFRSALTVMNGTVAWDLSGCFDPTNCIDIDPFTIYEEAAVEDPLKAVS